MYHVADAVTDWRDMRRNHTYAMNLAEAKQRIMALTPSLAQAPFVVLHTFVRNERSLHLALTDRFHRACRKGNVWLSPAFLTAIKNAEYGFDPHLARSRGGRDGIFLLDRTYRPPNPMMTKLFDRYLDVPDRGAADLASALRADIATFHAVRLVSHHLRLLGVLWQGTDADWLILVDYDDTK
jgi:hypothetical protein